MDQRVTDLARRLLQAGFNDLPARERRVITRIAKRVHVTENVNRQFEANLTFGQRLADHVAAFGGSWTFIIAFALILAVWILLNSVLLVKSHEVFDPYPYIFLNLVLSMLAAVQAPVIMMSQNRQAAKDRLMVGYDYEVNLKAELEIMRLHEKLDQMRQDQLTRMLERQEEQLRLIEAMVKP